MTTWQFAEPPLQAKEIPEAHKQQQHHCLCPAPFASLHHAQVSKNSYALLKTAVQAYAQNTPEEASLRFL